MSHADTERPFASLNARREAVGRRDPHKRILQRRFLRGLSLLAPLLVPALMGLILWVAAA